MVANRETIMPGFSHGTAGAACALTAAGRALTTPPGVSWSNTEHTRTPPELVPEPGFMQGAAGIAGWLSRLHALRTRPGSPVARPGPAWL